MKFIVLTGKTTRTSIYINPEFISSFQDGDEYSETTVYTADGNGYPYHVLESPEAILQLIKHCEAQREKT